MRTIFLLVAILAAGVVWGQTSPQITVSSEKVNVNGEVMYVHKVKGKETLYSIAKAYNVPIDELVRKNEQLKGGLKEGSTIYIPSKGAAPEAVSSVNAAVKEVGKTVTGSVDKTEAVTAQTASAAEKVQLPAEYFIKKYSKKKHIVKWYETLEDIAAKYNVAVNDICSLNCLKSPELKKKQVLYIPNDEFAKIKAEPVKTTEPDTTYTPVYSPGDGEETEENKQLNVLLESLKYIAPENARKNARIAYILPLNLADSTGANASFMDFYAGSLLAINGMKEEGMNIAVELIDQQMYSSMQDIVATGKVEDSTTDYIVGPVKAKDMDSFLKAICPEGYNPRASYNTEIISPMDLNAEYLVPDNEKFIQVPASQKIQQENLFKLFAGKCTSESNPVIIYENGGNESTLVKSAMEHLDSVGIKYTAISYGILEGREMMEKIMAVLSPESENLVLVPSNSEAFVSDVVRNLNLLYTNPVEENRRNVTLFGMARWRNFERIEVDYFHRMNLHLSLPYYVDYSREEVKAFLMKYRALYNSEPTPFAFQGYDITRYFLTMHSIYGHRFNSAFELDPEHMLQSKFHLIQKNSQLNGYENTGTVNIKYNNDYTVSVIE